MIQDGYKANFNAMLKAAYNGDLALVECKDAKTGLNVYAVCAVGRNGDEFVIVPLAKLFDGDPYVELLPPEIENHG